MLNEFKEFAMKGNMVDMALGIIIAFVLFLVVRNMNELKKKKEEAPAEPTDKDCPYCLSKIPIKAARCGHCTSEVPAA